MTWTLSAFADEASQSIDEQIAVLKQSNIDHVDLRNVDGINIVDLPIDHAKQVKEKLDAAGITVGMYGSPIGKIDITEDFTTDQNRLKHLGKLKKVFGATNVRTFSYFNKDNADIEEWAGESIDRLRQLCAIADDTGLVLYHENELGVFGGPLAQVQMLRDELCPQFPDQFKLIFDFDNYNQCGEDVWENYQSLIAHTHAIHLKESKKTEDGNFQHVPVGQGDGQIEKILTDLASRDWDGPLTLEPHLARSPAVLATGPHGQANASLADMSDAECFLAAAEAATALLKKIGKR